MKPYRMTTTQGENVYFHPKYLWHTVIEKEFYDGALWLVLGGGVGRTYQESIDKAISTLEENLHRDYPRTAPINLT